MKHLKTYFSVYLFLCGALSILFFSINIAKKPDQTVFYHDIQIYYSYLPATFIENDPFFERTLEYDSINKYWAAETPIGKRIPKTSMGVALLELPFFFAGHAYASNQTTYVANGFSEPYQIAIALSSATYAVLGAWFLLLFLQRRFTKLVSILTILLTLFGTNLMYYAIFEPGMSHPYSFFLLATVLLSIDNWFLRKTHWNSLLIGILLGLIVLVRPINILFIIPLIVLFKKPEETWSTYWKQLFFPLNHLGLIILGGIICWMPQFIYWKIQTGSILYFSYGEERFFWLKPHVFDGLFSIRKGWFIYTPLMLFALFGLIRLYKLRKNMFWTIASFLPLFLYVTFSWWCWWYGGGFSARTLIDILPLMALPLAGLIEWILLKKIRSILWVFPLFFVTLNLFQSWQYYRRYLHYDSMTWTSYKEVFFKTHPTFKYWETLDEPDYERALKKGD
jgi:hypothetical protein